MFTLLHISDLHRSLSDPISNEELLSALLNDHDSFVAEDGTASPVGAIVVSGDLVQGVALGDTHADAALSDQYEIAIRFIGSLTDAFLDGNRANVVVVPGNHDVDWNMARAAMTDEAPSPTLARLLRGRASQYRWSWETQRLYRITDPHMYERRFEHYCRAVRAFYDGAALPLPIDPARHYNIHLLDEGNIAVGAFNSCDGNDCYRFAGVINRSAIAQCDIAMREIAESSRLRMAVWHHNTVGSPERDDFMDPDTVSLMLTRGYRLGLHGHQHRSSVMPYSVQMHGEQNMAVVSAGSLCAGADDLPTGHARGYNYVQIADDYTSAIVHVREMTLPNTFTAGRLAALGGRSNVRVSWSSARITMPQSDQDQAVSAAEAAVARGDVDGARALLRSNAEGLDGYGRQLLIRLSRNAEAWVDLLKVMGQPRSVHELVDGVEAALQIRDFDRADAMLRLNLASTLDANTTAALIARVKSFRQIYR